jgi:hypothetical protein
MAQIPQKKSLWHPPIKERAKKPICQRASGDIGKVLEQYFFIDKYRR